MYVANCDNCKIDCEYGEWSCVGDESTAEEWARDAEWHTDGVNHYCPNCWSYDDNDQIVIDTQRTNLCAKS